MPKRTDLQSILILGSGPIVIGQAAEFDYSGTQACAPSAKRVIRLVRRQCSMGMPTIPLPEPLRERVAVPDRTWRGSAHAHSGREFAIGFGPAGLLAMEVDPVALTRRLDHIASQNAFQTHSSQQHL